MLNAASIVRSSSPYETLISQIIRLERLPQQRLESQRTAQNKYKDVLSDMDSKISALKTLLADFTSATSNPFGARSVNNGETDAFRVTASNGAGLGAHSLQVTRLAKADTRLTARYTADSSDLRTFFDTNGSQTFEIEVASPTSGDPDNRESISVTVNPAGTTNDEILEEIVTAINTAMGDAVDSSTISNADKALASLVRETEDSARFSLSSSRTGFNNRLSFTDSANGLLAALELNATSVVGTGTVISPLTTALLGGTDLTAPVVIDGTNQTLDLEINGATVNATIAAGTYNTLADLATAVGTAVGADLSVGVDGDALTFETAASGSAASIKITGGTSLSALGLTTMTEAVKGTDESLTITSARGGMVTSVGTSEQNSKLNSIFTLDGVSHYRSTNTITDALSDTTIELIQTSSSASEFSIASNNDSIKTDIKDFISKYNTLMEKLVKEGYVDADAGTRGNLAGDSVFSGLRFGMRGDVARAISGQPTAGPSYLADLGIEIKSDGTLNLKDEDDLISWVESNPDAVQSLFAGADGVATRLVDRLEQFVGTNGIIANRKDVVDDRISRLGDRITDWDERLAKREELLRAQYARLQEVAEMFQSQQNLLNNFFYA